jgi:methionyl-tRNA synthetase
MSAPWRKILTFSPGEPGEHVDKIVYCAAEALRMLGIMLQPYMPHKARMLLDQLGVRESRRTFEYCNVGGDLDYGLPMVGLGKGREGALFPPLTSEE